MPSFKWMFRLAILLSFAWVSFGKTPSPKPDGTPATGLDGALANISQLVNSVRSQATQHIASELSSRLDKAALESPLLAEIKAKATSALQGAQQQLGGTPGSEINVQALLQNASKIDQQQVISQLQNGVQQMIQQTGALNPDLRLGDSSE